MALAMSFARSLSLTFDVKNGFYTTNTLNISERVCGHPWHPDERLDLTSLFKNLTLLCFLLFSVNNVFLE